MSVRLFNSVSDALSSTWLQTNMTVEIIGSNLKYIVKSYGTENGITERQISTTGRYIHLLNKENTIAEAVGMVNDAKPFIASVSGTTVTDQNSTNSFTPDDVGKKIYIDRAEDKTTQLTAYTNYQGTVANHTALLALSPTADDLYQVTDTSDDSDAVDPTDVGYYHYNGSAAGGARFITIDRYERVIATITAYTDANNVTVDVTFATAVTDRRAVVGTDNVPAWDTLLDFAVGNGITTINLEGGYLFALDNSTSYEKTFTQLYNSINFVSKTRAQLYCPTDGDDFADNDLTTAIAQVNHRLFFFNQQGESASSELYVLLRNIDIIGEYSASFRRHGKLRNQAFRIHSGVGNIKNIDLFNCNIKSAQDPCYFSDGEINISNCVLDGFYSAEVGLGVFGVANLNVNNSKINNIGAPTSWTRVNLTQFDGRAIYIHPQLNIKCNNTDFYNTNGILQHFSGGGSDQIDNVPVTATYNGCNFFTTDSNRTFRGVYTSRVIGTTAFIKCSFMETTANSGINTALTLVGSVSCESCNFYGKRLSLGVTNVGSNNVFTTNENTFMLFDKNTFIDCVIDMYGHNNSHPPTICRITNCNIIHNGTNDQAFRAIAGSDPASTTIHKYYIEDCSITGEGDSSTDSILFTESGNGIEVYFKRCNVNWETTNGSGDTNFLKQLRNDVFVDIEDCIFEFEAILESDGTVDDAVTGRRNNFKSGISMSGSTSTNFGDLRFNLDLKHSTTITAAASTLITAGEEGVGEIDITGTTNIDTLYFAIAASGLSKTLSGQLRVNASGSNVNFVTGGNIAEAFTINDGGTALLEYNPDTQEFRILSGNNLA